MTPISPVHRAVSSTIAGLAPHFCTWPEHIDYALFSAFSLVINRDILVACSPRDSSRNIHHCPLVKRWWVPYYRRPKQISKMLANGISPSTKVLHWESYVKAGYYDVRARVMAYPQLKGWTQHGDCVGCQNFFSTPYLLVVARCQWICLSRAQHLAVGSGLSLSAAMVIVSTLAFLAANNKLAQCVTKRTLVDMTMENDRRIEVNSGGCAIPQC